MGGSLWWQYIRDNLFAEEMGTRPKWESVGNWRYSEFNQSYLAPFPFAGVGTVWVLFTWFPDASEITYALFSSRNTGEGDRLPADNAGFYTTSPGPQGLHEIELDIMRDVDPMIRNAATWED